MNILVIDDQPLNRKLLRVGLESEGYAVREAEDGVAALEALGCEICDLAICDILMPRMDGYRFCFEVRNDERFRHLPIIVHSSTYNSESDRALALQFGADAFVPRPSSFVLLLDAVRDLTQRRQQPVREAPKPVADMTVLKEYSKMLVDRLEATNAELEQTNRRLLLTHDELRTRTEELERAQQRLYEANVHLEERVRERTAVLDAVNKDLESFGYSVSHDLRTPLQSMWGYASMLRKEAEGSISPRGMHFIDRIVAATDRMQRFIDAMLRLSQLEQGDLSLADVDLTALAESTVQGLRDAQPQRSVEVTVAAGLRAHCDEGLIRIALENLVGNAWKFTAKEPVARITVDSQRQGEQVVFFVRDNGPGFAREDAPKLFECFKRLHVDPAYPGVGIGLATVARIMRRHGGRIWAEGSPGAGATFFLAFS